jgi:hypothetical protein
MPKRSSKDRDFVTIARKIVEQAIEEHLGGAPVDGKSEGKNPNAVGLGRLGGQKGGRVRAKKLSEAKRKAVSKKLLGPVGGSDDYSNQF